MYVDWWPPLAGLSFGAGVCTSALAQETRRRHERYPDLDDETFWEAWRISLIGPLNEPPEVLRLSVRILDDALTPASRARRRRHSVVVGLWIISAVAALVLGHADEWPALLLAPTIAAMMAWPTVTHAHRRARRERVTKQLALLGEPLTR